MKKQEKELWLKLYDEAFKLEKLEPWLYYRDIDIFYCESKELDEGYFACVMGMDGLYTAISIYTREQMYKYYQLLENDYNINIAMNYQNCLMCNFLTYDDTTPENIELIEKLGIEFPESYISFECFEEEYKPHSISVEQAKIMYEVFKVLNELLKDSIDKKFNPSFVGGKYPSRIYNHDTNEYENTNICVDIPEANFPKYNLDKKIVNAIKKLPKGSDYYEVEFLNYFYITFDEFVGKDKTYLPYINCIFDFNKKNILYMNFVDPKKFETKEEYVNFFLNKLYEQFKIHGKPKNLIVRDKKSAMALDDLKEIIDIEVASSLYIDDVYDDLMDHADLFFDM